MINETIVYVVEHRVEIFAVIGLVLTTATAIAKLTPTQKDDNFIEKVRKFFEKVSTLFLPDVKQK